MNVKGKTQTHTMDNAKFVLLSSRHATSRPSTDLSKFQVAPGGNISFAKRVKTMTPVKIFVPNIFPNIKSQMTVRVEGAGLVGTTAVLPVGYYTDTSLIEALNGLGLPDQTFSSEGGILSITNANASESIVSIDYPNAIQLGFSSTTPAVEVNGISSGVTTIPAGTTVSFPHVWNLGGEKLVHITSTKLAHSNLFHGKDGMQHDVAFTIPLHGTGYGDTACYQPGDSFMSAIRHTSEIQMDDLMFQITDSEMLPLQLPMNFHVDMLFKVIHAENE
jgi:hypothetical protein